MHDEADQAAASVDRFHPTGAVAVTGASSGIGEAVAMALGRLGVTVVGLDRAPPNRVPPRGVFMAMDVTNESEVELTVAAAEAQVGQLSGLVNAAGILGKVHSPERLRLADWEKELQVDLTGTYIVSKAAGVRMAQRSRGAIVNVASIAAFKSPARSVVYSGLKAGVLGITRAAAADLGARRIRVNAVAPGAVPTEGTAKHRNAELDARRIARTPLGRLGTVEDIADAICFLAGDGARFVNAEVIRLDGGASETSL